MSRHITSVTLFCRSLLPEVFLRLIQTMIASDPDAPIAAPSIGRGVNRQRREVRSVNHRSLKNLERDRDSNKTDRAIEDEVSPFLPTSKVCAWLAVMAAVCAAALGVTAAAAQGKPETSRVETHGIAVRARPILNFAKAGAKPTVSSRLEWRGGLVLSSASENFGGWSGLVLGNDGKSLLAVSDSGVWMSGTLTYDGKRPKALEAVRLGPLRTLKGVPLSRRRERDAEAITLASGTPRNGSAYIAFEQIDRIGLFEIKNGELGRPSRYIDMPKEAAAMRTDGIEGLTVLAGGPYKGSLVAFAENPLRGENVHRGWIWIGGKPKGFTISDLDGFSITDAASLDDGSVLIVERRFRWMEGLRVRLRLLSADSMKSGGSAKGEILLAANNGTAEIDNLEAIALSQDEKGETVVTLMSDDNFNRYLQRTVLLQFTLKDDPIEKTSEKKTGGQQ